MNKRLQQFITAENLSQSQFADKINVARASVSHILAGRNKPGFDFVEKMAKAFPALNIEWLITGKGKIYKTASAEPQQVPSTSSDYGYDLFADNYEQALAPEPLKPVEKPVAAPAPKPAVEPAADRTETAILSSIAKERYSQPLNKQRNISRIIVFYDDNTFQELK